MKHKQIKSSTKPSVDIVTPVYGGLNFIQILAQSLLNDYDAGVPFHWYIVDDATPSEKGASELISYLRELDRTNPNVTLIQNKVNGGYSKANNMGFSKGRSDYILMLNSDTKLKHDNWLKMMMVPLQENPIIGIVGPKLLFFEESTDDRRPAGMTQHAGVAFNILKQPYHIFLGWPPDHPKVTERRVMRAVTGACILTRRNIIKRLKGLAEIYTKGNFEDVEYCIHSTMMGYIVLYEPSVELFHFAGGSENSETAERNYQIFKLRNQNLLEWDDWRYY